MNGCLLDSICVYLQSFTDVVNAKTELCPFWFNLTSLKWSISSWTAFTPQSIITYVTGSPLVVMKCLLGGEIKEMESCFFFWQQYLSRTYVQYPFFLANRWAGSGEINKTCLQSSRNGKIRSFCFILLVPFFLDVTV